MARQRTIKFPPKRGKLTIRQIERAVDKVIQKRRAQETITSTPKEDRSGKDIVFISFCADDFHDINLLSTLLKNENSNIAFSDRSVKAPFNSEKSDYIKLDIRERIRQSSVTVVYVSDKTASSEWVDWEIRESLKMGKGVLAMYKGDTRPKHLPKVIVENNIEVLSWNQQRIEENLMSKKISLTDIPQVDIEKVNQAISDDYDQLNAKNAAKVMRNLELDELLVATAHELRSKNRRSVKRVALSKIQKSPEALALKEEYQREAQEGFTILQVGQTGVGKSSTINSLFDKEVAATNRFEPETRSVTPFEGTYNNVKYTIYDTPGLGEWSIGDLQLDKKYISLMKDQCSLPDVLWYVLRLDDNRVTAADANVLKLIHENFEEAIWDRTMIVFTHSDRLTSPERFQESFDGRTKAVNNVIVQITNRKIRGIPAAAVANGYECTPDGKSWLGKLFTSSFERLNPDRQNAFLLALATDLQIPEPQPPKPEVQNPKVNSSEEVRENKARIELTEDEWERVKKGSSGVSDVLAGGQIGAAIDLSSGGVTLGIPTVIGTLIGGIAGFIKWLWD